VPVVAVAVAVVAAAGRAYERVLFATGAAGRAKERVAPP